MAPLSDKTLSTLILSIYRAAEEPREWAACLESIRAATAGSGAALVCENREVCKWDVHEHAGFSDECIRLYREHYSRLDPWGQCLRLPGWTAGRVLDGREIVPDSVLKRSEYYNEFGQQHGCAKAIISVVEPVGARTAALTVNREARKPGFDEKALHVLRSLTPHLRLSLRLHRKLLAVDGMHASNCNALDRLPMGVVLVDRKGCPLFVNQAAMRLSALRDGFVVERDGLRAATATATRSISAAIAATVGLHAGEPPGGGESSFTLPRPSGERPLAVLVVPAGQAAGPWCAEAAASAALFIGALDDPPASPVQHLARFFDLTPREAEIAGLLADGAHISDIGPRLCLTRNTVRWHVKHVLQKSGVTRQADFVRLVQRGPGTLNAGARRR